MEGLFGRARFFISLVDPNTLEWEAEGNMPSLFSQQLVGIMTAQNLVRKNIHTVMTGKCGSKAFNELKMQVFRLSWIRRGRCARPWKNSSAVILAP